LTKEYKNKIRQEIYYIKKCGIDGHLSKIGEPNKQHYLNSLKGRVAFVLQTIPDDEEFLRYKEFLKNVPK
jgi:RNA-directed DNA polymerase